MLQFALLFLRSAHTVLMPSWDSLVSRRAVLLHPCPGGGVVGGVPIFTTQLGLRAPALLRGVGRSWCPCLQHPAWEHTSSPQTGVPTTPCCWFPTSIPGDEEEKGIPLSLPPQPFSFLHAANQGCIASILLIFGDIYSQAGWGGNQPPAEGF